MYEPDPEEQDLADRDRATVLACDHALIELTAGVAKHKWGPVLTETITCMGCPTEVSLFFAHDPRDDMYAGYPLGN